MIDIILLAMVAVFVVTRLYFIFGTNAESKGPRVVVKRIEKLPRDMTPEQMQKLAAVQEVLEKTMCANENCLPEGRVHNALARIENFDADSFLIGASKVFEIILQAFNDGNIETIRHLLSKKIYDAFNQAIRARQKNHQTSEVEFICFEKSEVKDVRFLKNSVRIIVEFVTQQINILRGADGKVITGDENFVQKITDVWTFERALHAKENNWILVSTKKNA